jgi:hypothetical protein
MTAVVRKTQPQRRPVGEDTPVLSASEIASYAFCGQAWHLSRSNVARNASGVESLEAGTVAHRRIGARTDRLRSIELVRRLVALAICALTTIVLFQALSNGVLRLPW